MNLYYVDYFVATEFSLANIRMMIILVGFINPFMGFIINKIIPTFPIYKSVSLLF